MMLSSDDGASQEAATSGCKECEANRQVSHNSVVQFFYYYYSSFLLSLSIKII